MLGGAYQPPRNRYRYRARARFLIEHLVRERWPVRKDISTKDIGNGYQRKEQSRLRGRVRVRLGKRAGIQDGDIREIDRDMGKLLLGKRLF